MIALVTGAGGFLGIPLCQALLNSGYEVRGLDRISPPGNLINRPGLSWIQRDLIMRGPSPEEIDGVEVLFHLAGVKESENENSFLAGNEGTTLNVLKACAGKIRKIIHASSQMVYGDIDSLSVDESFPLLGYNSAYACSKVNCENWLKWFHKEKGGTAISLRFTGFIEGGGAIDYYIAQALKGEPIEVYSLGKICRDYLSVRNGIQAFQAAARADFGTSSQLLAYNIGSGERMTTLELAKLVVAELGSASEVVPVPQMALRSNFVFNIAKARNELGFRPQPLATGVKSYIGEKAKIHEDL